MILRRRTSFIVAICLVATLLVGCSRDPNARKQKYLESGKGYLAKQEYREAIIQFSNALQIDKNFAEAHYQLAQAYGRMGAWSSAYAELQRTVDLDPSNTKARLDMGNLLLAAREFDKAQECASFVLAKDPNNPDAHALQANIFAAKGEINQALPEMQKAVQLAPTRSQLYINLASLQMSAGQVVDAEGNLKKAVETDPKAAQGYVALGSFYQQQHRWTEGEQQFRKAVEVEPKSADARALLAKLFIAQQNNDQAEQVLAQAKKELSNDPKAYRMLGEFYLATGKVDKALDEFASLVKEHPKDLALKRNYIQLLLQQNRLDQAGRLNDDILKSNSKDPEALIFRGQIQLAQQKPADAMQSLEAALRTEPDNAVAHYQLGRVFALTGDMGRAEQEWRQAARLQPNLLQVHQALSSIAVQKNDVDLMSTSAEAMVNLDPLAPGGYILRAMVAEGRKQQDKVEADLQKAIQVAPQNADGYAALGEWRLRQKRFGDAEKLLEQALALNVNHAAALQTLVRLYDEERLPVSKSAARIEKQIAKSPQNSVFYVLLAIRQANNKQFAEAEGSLQKAVELDRNNLAALMALGQVQVAAGSRDKAIATWEKWSQQDPKDPRPYLMLGMLQEGINWQKAQDLYQKAMQTQPNYPPAANNLAYLMLEHGGNSDVALSLAQVARVAMPDSPNVADTLAWAYIQKGFYRMAIDLLQEALHRSPKNATYEYHLGLAYDKQNDSAKAKDHLQKALQIDPNFPQAGEIRRMLTRLARG